MFPSLLCWIDSSSFSALYYFLYCSFSLSLYIPGTLSEKEGQRKKKGTRRKDRRRRRTEEEVEEEEEEEEEEVEEGEGEELYRSRHRSELVDS